MTVLVVKSRLVLWEHRIKSEFLLDSVGDERDSGTWIPEQQRRVYGKRSVKVGSDGCGEPICLCRSVESDEITVVPVRCHRDQDNTQDDKFSCGCHLNFKLITDT